MTTIVLIFILTITILLFILRRRYYEKYKDIEKLPGPKTVPLFGNLLQLGMNATDIFNNFKHLSEKYGPVVRLWIGPFDVRLLVTDRKYIEYVLENANGGRSEMYNILEDLFQEGLLLTTGEKWKKQRKITNPMFYNNMLEQYMKTFNKHADILIENINSRLEEPINTEVLGSDVALGTSTDVLMNIHVNNNSIFATAMDGITQIFTKRMFSPFLRNAFCFKLSKEYRQQTDLIKIIHNFIDVVIEKRKNERKNNGISSTTSTFLDYYLDASDETGVFTSRDIRNHLITMFVGSFHNVSQSIAFALYELSKHADTQNKILQEVRNIVGEDKGVEVTFKDVHEMKYLDCVLKEVMRIHTIASIFERQLTEDSIIDGLMIPKGTTVTLWAYGLHQSKDIYPNPTKFDPDRFLPENVAKRPELSYLPFSAGPKNCIGQKYATYWLKLIVAKVLLNYEIIPVKHNIIYGFQITLKPQNGLPVKFKRRRD